MLSRDIIEEPVYAQTVLETMMTKPEDRLTKAAFWLEVLKSETDLAWIYEARKHLEAALYTAIDLNGRIITEPFDPEKEHYTTWMYRQFNTAPKEVV